jgi:hypothetical protein
MTRIIGVEVACGPIDTTFIYTTDNLQSGGANTLVDIIDLVKLLLATLPLSLVCLIECRSKCSVKL